MAIIHQATLTPSKLEILSTYLSTLPYLADANSFELSTLGAYRFDDPAGAVGIETHLLTISSVPVIHIPLTYREAPLAGADEWLLGTMEHSVLGPRWVYNGCADPIYVAELLRTMLTGDSQVDLYVETDDGPVQRESSVLVAGSGMPATTVPAVDSVVSALVGNETTIQVASLEIVVRHIIGDSAPTNPQETLTGTWSGSDQPAILAFVR